MTSWLYLLLCDSGSDAFKNVSVVKLLLVAQRNLPLVDSLVAH